MAKSERGKGKAKDLPVVCPCHGAKRPMRGGAVESDGQSELEETVFGANSK
jgi:nitrite reductase/ring-hydroxylating ferredoxin subunit